MLEISLITLQITLSTIWTSQKINSNCQETYLNLTLSVLEKKIHIRQFSK